MGEMVFDPADRELAGEVTEKWLNARRNFMPGPYLEGQEPVIGAPGQKPSVDTIMSAFDPKGTPTGYFDGERVKLGIGENAGVGGEVNPANFMLIQRGGWPERLNNYFNVVNQMFTKYGLK